MHRLYVIHKLKNLTWLDFDSMDYHMNLQILMKYNYFNWVFGSLLNRPVSWIRLNMQQDEHDFALNEAN